MLTAEAAANTGLTGVGVVGVAVQTPASPLLRHACLVAVHLLVQALPHEFPGVVVQQRPQRTVQARRWRRLLQHSGHRHPRPPSQHLQHAPQVLQAHKGACRGCNAGTAQSKVENPLALVGERQQTWPIAFALGSGQWQRCHRVAAAAGLPNAAHSRGASMADAGAVSSTTKR